MKHVKHEKILFNTIKFDFFYKLAAINLILIINDSHIMLFIIFRTMAELRLIECPSKSGTSGTF